MKSSLIYYPIEETYGKNLSDPKLAIELRQNILEEIDLGFDIEIDFKDVIIATNEWCNDIFGFIVKNKGKNFLNKHISIINANKNIDKSISKHYNHTEEINGTKK
jgi:hypothetical protein